MGAGAHAGPAAPAGAGGMAEVLPAAGLLPEGGGRAAGSGPARAGRPGVRRIAEQAIRKAVQAMDNRADLINVKLGEETSAASPPSTTRQLAVVPRLAPALTSRYPSPAYHCRSSISESGSGRSARAAPLINPLPLSGLLGLAPGCSGYTARFCHIPAVPKVARRGRVEKRSSRLDHSEGTMQKQRREEIGMWGQRTHCGYVLLCGHGWHRSGTLERPSAVRMSQACTQSRASPSGCGSSSGSDQIRVIAPSDLVSGHMAED